MDNWEKWQCRGCGSIITNPKERQTLDSDINPAVYQLVLSCLKSYYGSTLEENAVKSMLLPCNPSVKGKDRSYLCRKVCFASMEKVINNERKISELTAEINKIKSDFLHKIACLYSSVEEPSIVSSQSPANPPPTKKQRTSQGRGSLPHRNLFTVVASHPTESVASPTVTVSEKSRGLIIHILCGTTDVSWL